MATLFHKTAPVQAAILVEMIRMLQEASRDFTIPSFPTAPVKPEPPSESPRLIQAGFINAKPIVDYERLTKQYEKAMKKWRKRTDALLEVTEMRHAMRHSIEVLIDARKKFGSNTLLINFADFERIMRRYNLICGPFENYTGSIPMAKLEEIEQLKLNYRKTYPKYIHDHVVEGDEWTILMDEPDRNLDIENIGQIRGILNIHKPHAQIIAVVHNPLLICALAKNPEVNFIEMTRGYVNKIKKLVKELV